MAAQARLESDVALLQLVDRPGGQQRSTCGRRWHRRARAYRSCRRRPACCPPRHRSVRAQESQIAIVLQAFLEIVVRPDGVQVARLGRIGQRRAAARTSHSGVCSVLGRAAHPACCPTGCGRSRRRARSALAANDVSAALVVLRRLRVGIRACRTRTAPPDTTPAPPSRAGCGARSSSQGASARLVVPERGIRPADRQQRLVRIRAVQAHALQRHARLAG